MNKKRFHMFSFKKLDFPMTVLGQFDSQHEDMVHDAQMDFYGKRLATASSDRTVRIHDASSGDYRTVATLKGHEGPVWSVSWAHPKFGSLLASASYDGRVIVWKEEHGQWSQLHQHTLHSSSGTIVICDN
jgi:protein transport protein SEC13